MKTMKQLLFIIFFVALATNLMAKEKVAVRGDSIRIRFENSLLEVSTFDLKINTLGKAEIPGKVNQLILLLDKIEIKTPAEGEKVCIRSSNFMGGVKQEFNKLELRSEKENAKTLIISEGQILETDFGNFVLEIEDENYLIRFYLNKLEDAEIVNSTEFETKIKAADIEIPENRKKTNAWLIENENSEFNTYFLGELPPLTLDMLELNAGIASGWIHNQFVSGFTFRVGLAFAKKGIMRNKYFADYEVLYDFSNPKDNNMFDVNGFLAFGYERNFSMNPEKASWYGISAGYLVDRGNTFFEKNTFKLAVHKQISNSITLKPEIYFNDFFKNGSPALQVQITF